MAMRRIALVLGGDGALGRAVVQSFRDVGWTTLSIDRRRNANADDALELKAHSGTPESFAAELKTVREYAARWGPAHAVVCAAGGWAGGGAGDAAVSDALSSMVDQCLRPALTASHLAATSLAPGGTLVLLGSAAALGPTPGMLAYGAVKAATHHMIASLAAPGGLPVGVRVFGVLPRVLDTPSNRASMGSGDTSSWTPLPHVASKISEWCVAGASGSDGAARITASGTLAEPVTEQGSTSWRLHAPIAAQAVS